jgi:hypothetical protein
MLTVAPAGGVVSVNFIAFRDAIILLRYRCDIAADVARSGGIMPKTTMNTPVFAAMR